MLSIPTIRRHATRRRNGSRARSAGWNAESATLRIARLEGAAREFGSGGHFPALEVPALLSDDIRAFFSSLAD